MSKLRRYFASGQICFVTTVTHERRPILIANIDILKQAYRATRKARKFEIIGWVVMPDHIHALVHCPDGDFSMAMTIFKRSFAYWYNLRTKQTGRVWQHRFYDHIIRTESEILKIRDYMHMNPVRRGLTNLPEEWQWSSIKRRRIGS